MSLPFDLWKYCYEARRDVQAALDTVERGEVLSVAEWMAYVWYLSGIPTMETAREKSRTYFMTTLQRDGSQSCNWFHVSEICRPGRAWVRELGAVKMRELLSLLDDEQQRRFGWNALCGSGNEDAPNLPEVHTVVTRTANRMSLDMPDTPTAPKLSVLDGGKRQELERELAGVGAHMNPVNGFFAEE